MSTIQISIPDALLGRMTSEEIREFLHEQIQRLSDMDISFANPSLGDTDVFASADFSLEAEIQAKSHQNIDFTNHPFIGIWSDREDMLDSTEYVRHLRKEMNRFPPSFSGTP
jgi:hypothetical protein